MINLLSNAFSNQPLETHRKTESTNKLPARSKQQVRGANHHGMRNGGLQRNDVQRNDLLERIHRPAPKLAEQQTERHHHQHPNKEKSCFRVHFHSPDHRASRRALTSPPGRKRSLRLLCRHLRRQFWLWRFVADQAHFAEQLRHLHAGEGFEERRHLRGNLGDVSG
jgi:hypothetical protein